VPGIVGLPAGLWLADHVGFSATFLVGAAVAIVGLCSAPWIPSRAPQPQRGTSVLAALRSSALIGPSIAFTATTCAAGIIVTFLPLALGHGSGSRAILGLLVQATTATITRWWAGRHCDRHGPAGLLVPGLLTAAAGMLLLALFANPAALLGSMALFGAGFGITQTSTLTLMLSRVKQPGYPAVNAAWNFAYDGGWGLGAAVFGLIVAHTGFSTGFVLTAVLVLTSLAPALREPRVRPSESAITSCGS
jgi:predicted MFS family arabinose efflux permease